jgi:hypothetical protein
MKRYKQLSREARKRKLGSADTHKLRRHWGKIYMNAGYTQQLLKVDLSGRKHWYYVRCLNMPTHRSVYFPMERTH